MEEECELKKKINAIDIWLMCVEGCLRSERGGGCH